MMNQHDYDLFKEKDWYYFLFEEIREEASRLIQNKNYTAVVTKVVEKHKLPHTMREPLYTYIVKRQKLEQKKITWGIVIWILLGAVFTFLTYMFYTQKAMFVFIGVVLVSVIAYAEYGVNTRIRNAFKEYFGERL